jgi:hypothetical protein
VKIYRPLYPAIASSLVYILIVIAPQVSFPLFTHYCFEDLFMYVYINGKMSPVETTPGMAGEG